MLPSTRRPREAPRLVAFDTGARFARVDHLRPSDRVELPSRRDQLMGPSWFLKFREPDVSLDSIGRLSCLRV